MIAMVITFPSSDTICPNKQKVVKYKNTLTAYLTIQYYLKLNCSISPSYEPLAKTSTKDS